MPKTTDEGNFPSYTQALGHLNPTHKRAWSRAMPDAMPGPPPRPVLVNGPFRGKPCRWIRWHRTTPRGFDVFLIAKFARPPAVDRVIARVVEMGGPRRRTKAGQQWLDPVPLERPIR